MLDNEQFKKEIAAQLKDVPREKCVAVAVRLAMRMLPLLAVQDNFMPTTTQEREVFWFWHSTTIHKHLLSILTGYSCSIEYSLTKKYTHISTIDVAAHDAFMTTTSAYFDTRCPLKGYSAAISIANISKIAVSDDYFATTIDAAYSIVFEASFFSKNFESAIIQEIRWDLEELNVITTEKLLHQPLWSKTIPIDWQQQLTDFKNDVLSLNAGFEIWLDWYEDYSGPHCPDNLLPSLR